MDKIIKITLGLFIVLLAAFTGIVGITVYQETAYRNTLSGTYTYTCMITTDAPLTNVTFFIPVPTDTTGNSPMVSAFSSRMMNGVPAEWKTTLFDTGKATLVKVTTPAIVTPEGTSANHPFTIAISSETTSRTPIDTLNPEEKSALFRPVQELSRNPCPQGTANGTSQCFTYTTSLYADYSTAADTTVTITSTVSGKNTWTLFEPHSNEYHTAVSATINGENHGWVVLEGELSSGTGTYDIHTGA